MLIKNKNSALRLELPCTSPALLSRGKNRVVILVDDEMYEPISRTVDWMGLADSKGQNTGHLPIINYYYAQPNQKIVSIAELMLHKKRIHRDNPYPDTNRNTFVFDERLSNFKLTADTKLMLLDSNPNLRPYELDGIDNFGDLKDEFGFARFKKLVAKLNMYNY
jgi:hypothetical protein